VEKSFGKETTVGITLILECTRCGGLLMAADGQRTRTCPYCGSRINIIRANKVAAAKNAFEASEILRELKSKKGFAN
jgi:DNA-directed RNA polymerase subunit RPC12/RpoP